MRDRPYYSVRTGKHPTSGRLDLAGLKGLVLSTYNQFEASGHFQQAFGYHCVDAGFVPGLAGADIGAFFFRKLKKRQLWPIESSISDYSEDDLFDVLELLHDCVSYPVDGHYHSWANCGWHYSTFDSEKGRSEFREVINEVLRDYSSGYQLTTEGNIVALPPLGLAQLEDSPAPPGDPKNVQARVTAAIRKFRRRGSTQEERRDAVRDLADVLEYLRPQIKQVLSSKDESDLFALANNFGIRHHNDRQKTGYDGSVWLSWMFYYYLATIHAVTRLIARKPSE
jgi:hypothetical protein